MRIEVSVISLFLFCTLGLPAAGTEYVFHVKALPVRMIGYRPSAQAVLPQLIARRMFAGKMILYLNRETRRAHLDGTYFPVGKLPGGMAIVVPIPNSEKWLGRPHTLGLEGSAGVPHRFYQLFIQRAESPLDPFAFEVMGSLSVTGGENVFAPLVNWTPRYRLFSRLSVYPSVGGSVTRLPGKRDFLAWQAQGFLSYQTGSWHLDVGGGYQEWARTHAQQGPMLCLKVGVLYGQTGSAAKHRVFLGYSPFFPAGGLVHQIKLGLGFSL